MQDHYRVYRKIVQTILRYKRKWSIHVMEVFLRRQVTTLGQNLGHLPGTQTNVLFVSH
jgi:hypothetical protein